MFPWVLGPALEECFLEGHHGHSQHSNSGLQTHLLLSLAGQELSGEETLLTGCVCKEESIRREGEVKCYVPNVCVAPTPPEGGGGSGSGSLNPNVMVFGGGTLEGN